MEDLRTKITNPHTPGKACETVHRFQTSLGAELAPLYFRVDILETPMNLFISVRKGRQIASSALRSPAVWPAFKRSMGMKVRRRSLTREGRCARRVTSRCRERARAQRRTREQDSFPLHLCLTHSLRLCAAAAGSHEPPPPSRFAPQARTSLNPPRAQRESLHRDEHVLFSRPVVVDNASTCALAPASLDVL